MRYSRAFLVSVFFVVFCLSFAQEELATARDGTLAQVDALIAQGLDVTIQDAYGQTVLMYAATGNEDPEVITSLVNAGANIDEQTLAGWTALMYAVRDNPNPKVAERLLDLGADADIENSDANKALDYADSIETFQDPLAYYQLRNATTEDAPEPTYTPPAVTSRSCCKYCSTGKACGDSCISRSYNCSKGVGCACNASDLDKNDPAYAMLKMMQPEPKVVVVNTLGEAALPFVDCAFVAAFDAVHTALPSQALAQGN